MTRVFPIALLLSTMVATVVAADNSVDHLHAQVTVMLAATFGILSHEFSPI